MMDIKFHTTAAYSAYWSLGKCYTYDREHKMVWIKCSFFVAAFRV